MGFRFRKSFGFGPFRTTISKTGVSTSVGVKGARITKRADGKTQTTVSIPGTGIYHTSTASESKSAPKPAPASPATSYPKTKTSPYEHVSFYLKDTRIKNPDGTKRQDVLYWYKMRKPPFDQQVDVAVLSDPEKPELVQISLNGQVVGKAPKDKAQYICENWNRMDCVSALDVEGPRGEYEAYTVVRLHTIETELEPTPDPEQKTEPEPVSLREEQMRDYYDMGTKKQGCGCAIALGAAFLVLVLLLII